MSLSTSTEQLSSEIDLILLDKNLPSPKLVIARTVSIVLSQQTDKTEENSKIYVKKNGTPKFKIKSENESEAYIYPHPMTDESFSQENELKSNHAKNSRDLWRDSNHFEAKLLEFETPSIQVCRPFYTQQQLQSYQKFYFGNYFPDRTSYPDKIFVSKIFNQNLESIKNFYLTQSYPNLLQFPKVFLKQKDKSTEPPKEKENIIQIKPKEKILQ